MGVWPRRPGSESSTAYMCICSRDVRAWPCHVPSPALEGTGSASGAGTSGSWLHNRAAALPDGRDIRTSWSPGSALAAPPAPWDLANGSPKWVIGTRGGSVQPQRGFRLRHEPSSPGRPSRRLRPRPDGWSGSSTILRGVVAGARYRRGHARQAAVAWAHTDSRIARPPTRLGAGVQ